MGFNLAFKGLKYLIVSCSTFLNFLKIISHNAVRRGQRDCSALVYWQEKHFRLNDAWQSDIS